MREEQERLQPGFGGHHLVVAARELRRVQVGAELARVEEFAVQLAAQRKVERVEAAAARKGARAGRGSWGWSRAGGPAPGPGRGWYDTSRAAGHALAC